MRQRRWLSVSNRTLAGLPNSRISAHVTTGSRDCARHANLPRSVLTNILNTAAAARDPCPKLAIVFVHASGGRSMMEDASSRRRK
jgi:hypothetical protein